MGEEEKEETFETGALVSLKSGGEEMTVAGYEQSSKEWFVRVVWMYNGSIQRDLLAGALLKKVSD